MTDPRSLALLRDAGNNVVPQYFDVETGRFRPVAMEPDEVDSINTRNTTLLKASGGAILTYQYLDKTGVWISYNPRDGSTPTPILSYVRSVNMLLPDNAGNVTLPIPTSDYQMIDVIPPTESVDEYPVGTSAFVTYFERAAMPEWAAIFNNPDLPDGEMMVVTTKTADVPAACIQKVDMNKDGKFVAEFSRQWDASSEEWTALNRISYVETINGEIPDMSGNIVIDSYAHLADLEESELSDINYKDGMTYGQSISGDDLAHFAEIFESVTGWTIDSSGISIDGRTYKSGGVKHQEIRLYLRSSNDENRGKLVAIMYRYAHNDGWQAPYVQTPIGIGSRVPEGEVQAFPGCMYYSTTEEKMYVKSKGNNTLSDEGWLSITDEVSVALNEHSQVKASTSVLGHVKVDGSTIAINGDGVIAVNPANLPKASTTVEGIVMLTNEDGNSNTKAPTQFAHTILKEALEEHATWTATHEELGHVIVDGETIKSTEGVISVDIEGLDIPALSTSLTETVEGKALDATVAKTINDDLQGHKDVHASVSAFGHARIDGVTLDIINETGQIKLSDSYQEIINDTADDLDAHIELAANGETLGHVMIDNNSIVINEDGQIEVSPSYVPELPIFFDSDMKPNSSPSYYNEGITYSYFNGYITGEEEDGEDGEVEGTPLTEWLYAINMTFGWECKTNDISWTIETRKTGNDIYQYVDIYITANYGSSKTGQPVSRMTRHYAKGSWREFFGTHIVRMGDDSPGNPSVGIPIGLHGNLYLRLVDSTLWTLRNSVGTKRPTTSVTWTPIDKPLELKDAIYTPSGENDEEAANSVYHALATHQLLNSHAALLGGPSQVGHLRIDNDTLKFDTGTFKHHVPIATDEQKGVVKVDNSSIVVDADGVISVAPKLGGPGAEPPMMEILFSDIISDEFWDTGVYVLRASEDNDFGFGDASLNGLASTKDWIVDITYDQYYSETLEALVKIKHIEVAPFDGPVSYYFRGNLKHVIYDDTSIDPTTTLSEFFPEVAPFNTDRFFTNEGIYDINVAGFVKDGTYLFTTNDGKLSINIPEATEDELGLVFLTDDLESDASYTAISASAANVLYNDIEDLKEQANDFAPVDDGEGNLNVSPGHVYVDGTTITIDNGVISAVGDGGGGGGPVEPKAWWSGYILERGISQTGILTFSGVGAAYSSSEDTADANGMLLEGGKAYRVTLDFDARFYEDDAYMELSINKNVDGYPLLSSSKARLYGNNPQEVRYGSGSMNVIVVPDADVYTTFRIYSMYGADYISNVSATIEQIGDVAASGPSTIVINGLTSTSATSALSANQGRVLNERLEDAEDFVDEHPLVLAPTDDGDGNVGAEPGHVIVDGETIVINEDGIISAVGGSGSGPSGEGNWLSFLKAGWYDFDLGDDLELDDAITNGIDCANNKFTLEEGKTYRVTFGADVHIIDSDSSSGLNIDFYDENIEEEEHWFPTNFSAGNGSGGQRIANKCLMDVIYECPVDMDLAVKVTYKSGVNYLSNISLVVQEVSGGGSSAPATPVVNNLTSDSTTSALSAKMGKDLHGLHTTLNGTVSSHVGKVAGSLLDSNPAMGHVIIDGDTIVMDEDGVISVATPAALSYQVRVVYFMETLAQGNTEVTFEIEDAMKAANNWEVYSDGLLVPSSRYTLDGDNADEMKVTFPSAFNYTTEIMLRGQKVEAI